MTRQEAIEMIESGKVSAKGFIRDRKINRVDVTEEIWAFQNEGKYFLLITKYDKAFYFKDHDFADVVVESFTFNGKYYMFVAHVNQHREEVRWEDLWEFDTAKEANDYFKKHIKDRDGFADYLICKSNEAYADYMMRAVGTLD